MLYPLSYGGERPLGSSDEGAEWQVSGDIRSLRRGRAN